jgi:hypothetical protein
LEGLGIIEKEVLSRVSDKEDVYVNDLNVGDIATTDYKGAYVMRIA